MYEFNQLDDNGDIFYLKNSFTVPQKYLEFLEEIDLNKDSYQYIEKWKDWTASNDKSNVYGKQKHINNFKNLSQNQNLNKRILYLINAIKEPLLMCSTKYLFDKKMGVPTEINSFAINKYYPGKGMGPHTDSYEKLDKKRFSILIYLNDNYNGGEIEFPNQNIKLKPEAGSVLIFPTYQPFVHQSYEIFLGNKYFVLAEFGIEEQNANR